MNLAGTIEELKQTAKDLRLPDLRKLVEGLKPEPAEITPYVQFTENHYSRNLVFKTPNFEVLVLCWRAGQRSPIHDHGSSICTVYTVDGVLSADNYRKTSSGLLGRFQAWIGVKYSDHRNSSGFEPAEFVGPGFAALLSFAPGKQLRLLGHATDF